MNELTRTLIDRTLVFPSPDGALLSWLLDIVAKNGKALESSSKTIKIR